MIKELFSFIGKIFLVIGKVFLWIWLKIKYLLVALKEIHDIKKHNTFKDKRVEYLVKSSKLDD